MNFNSVMMSSFANVINMIQSTVTGFLELTEQQDLVYEDFQKKSMLFYSKI